MIPADSGGQIGPTMLWRGLLITKEGICEWVFKNCDVSYVFISCGRTVIDTEKRTIPLDSVGQIGL